MERVVRERMTITDPEQATPSALINIRPGRRGDEGVLRRLAALAVHGPDQPAGGADAQAQALRPGPRRPLPRPRRLRRARRPPQPLRPHLPDRDAGRPEHRPDRLAGLVRRDQRLRLHRDALPPRHPRAAGRLAGPPRPHHPRGRGRRQARRWPRPARRSPPTVRRSWRRWASSTSRCGPTSRTRSTTWPPTTRSSTSSPRRTRSSTSSGHFLEDEVEVRRGERFEFTHAGERSTSWTCRRSRS